MLRFEVRFDIGHKDCTVSLLLSKRAEGFSVADGAINLCLNHGIHSHRDEKVGAIISAVCLASYP